MVSRGNEVDLLVLSCQVLACDVSTCCSNEGENVASPGVSFAGSSVVVEVS